jgi:lysophospholipase L1-like esterase
VNLINLFCCGRVFGARLCVVTLLLAVLPLEVAQAVPTAGQHWVLSWAAAAQSVSDQPDAPSFDRAPAVNHQTVRQIIYSRLAGHRLRIHISNRYGRTPLAIAQTRIALSGSFAALEPGSDRVVTFGGRSNVVIAPGAEIQSDPVPLAVPAGGALAVSFFIDSAENPSTWHKLASQVNYLSVAGNHTSDQTGVAFRGHFTSYLWLEALDIDVDNNPRAYAVVAIGDSITDGMRSTLNANRRWPDVLARGLAGSGVAVVNQGISGNRLLSDSPCYGERLLNRFDTDALSQPGVRTVLVLIGINDINFAATPPRAGLDCDFPHTRVSEADLIQGYRTLISAAHARGVRIIGATVTPASLPTAREAIRNAVNQWVRTSGAFDAVVDFDMALRNPARPDELLPRYDSNDHIHPNDAGYAEMARQVALRQFEGR